MAEIIIQIAEKKCMDQNHSTFEIQIVIQCQDAYDFLTNYNSWSEFIQIKAYQR